MLKFIFLFIIFSLIASLFRNRRPGQKSGGMALGGILGFMFAGPLGAIAGAYFGSGFDRAKMEQGPMTDRSVFEINLIAILSYVARADGRIDPEEIKVIFNSLGLRASQSRQFQQALMMALKQDIALKETCENFKKVSKYEDRLMLLRIVFRVAMADGELHPHEKKAIEEIVFHLEINADDYASLQGEYVVTADKYYQILGLSQGATKAEIKKAYRKLALTHHPDRVAHLGEEYVKEATATFQKINDAYERLRAA